MQIPRTSPSAHPWLSSALWVTSAVAGTISIILAFSVLLDSKFTESGISIFRFNFTTLLPTQFVYEPDQELVNVPDVASGDVPPILATAAGGAISGIQAAQSVVSSGVQTAATKVGTALQSAATKAGTAVQSGVDTMVPKNMTIGLGKVCFGWENSRPPDCHGLPFNISSVVPSTISGFLGGPLRQLQEIEKKVVSAILETVRGSLIAAIVLLLLFFLLLLFWEFPNELWKRAIMTPLGFACLVVPFLISTAVLFVVQSDIHKEFDGSSLVSVQDGEVSNLVMVGFVFSILMFAASVAITMI